MMCENLQFSQTFGAAKDLDKMLAELLADIEPADSHSIEVDQVLLAAPLSRTQSSESSSSISSLASQALYESPRLSVSSSSASSSSSFSMRHTKQPSAVASMPILEASDTDPEYNVTLTADMFSGMRQAISVSQAMDIEAVPHQMHSSTLYSLETSSNSTCAFNLLGEQVMGQLRASSFNEANMPTPDVRHKFTVATQRDGSIEQATGHLPSMSSFSSPLPSIFQDNNCQHNRKSMDFKETHLC